MNKLYLLSLVLVLLVTSCTTKDYMDVNLPVEDRVDALLKLMTIEEKVAQIKSSHTNSLIAANEGGNKEENGFESQLKFGIGAIENIGDKRTPAESVEFTNTLQKYLVENTRLKIPAIIASECLHGHHGFNSTSFPVPIAMACSFNDSLVHEVYKVVGREARLRGSHSAHSPNLDIGRDPRWGRIEETFGEDAYLVSRMAYASVAGLQGSNSGNPGTTHIVANSKHYAGYGQGDGGRNFAPTVTTPRIFFDEILKPFEVAVKEARGQGIMPSHNEIDGIPAHANQQLLTDILRDKWGFQGVVVTDYNDVPRLYEFHRVAESYADAAVLGLKSGVDMDIPRGRAYALLLDKVKDDPKLEKYIDRSVKRVLRLKFMLGLFENPYADPKAAEFVGSEANRELAKKITDESIVLLKNENNLLPLNKSNLKSIAVIGPKAKAIEHGAYASANEHTVSILQGIENYVGNGIKVSYEEGCKVGQVKKINGQTVGIEFPLEDEINNIKKAAKLAAKSDVAIVCVGSEMAWSKEAYYAKGHAADRSSIHLLGNQLELVRRVMATGTPTVVVLMHGKPLAIPELAEESQALVDIFYLGQTLGTSVADVLFGDVNPSGKLSVSYPRSVGQLPVYYSQKISGVFKHYLDNPNTPLYPFGYGLSYTEYEYSNLILADTVMSKEEDLHFECSVKNIGSVGGKEAVQVYIFDQYASVTRPVKQLIRFKKVELKVGEEKRVKFTITAEDLSFTGPYMQKIIESGKFDLMIGAASDDIRMQTEFMLK